MHWLLERIRDFGDRPALAMSTGVHSYASLAAEVERRFAEMYAAGVKSGEVVAIFGEYSLFTVSALLACLERSCIAVPVASGTDDEAGARMRVARATRRWESSGLRCVPCDDSVAPLYGTLRANGRAGLVLFSSGTSGEPKALVHDFDALADSYRDRRAKALALLVFLLFDHIGGLNTLFNGLASGATLVVPRDRSPEAVEEAVAAHRVAVLPASPTFLNLLLISGCAKRFDLSSLRIITYGTEPMPESLLRRLREMFPWVKFIQTFGTSETGIARTVSKSSDSTLLRFDDPGQEWKIVDGELWLRSKTRALGYLNHPSDRFTPDGWFRTGDRVEPTDDDFLRITGRFSEIINVGGEKVMPAEVESAILEVPGVIDALVRGEPNPITGSMVVASVVPEVAGGSDELKRAIRAHCRTVLTGYKVPAKVVFADSLPAGMRMKKIRRS